MIVYLNIGSNLKNRLRNILEAIAYIQELDWVRYNSLVVSHPIESKAWGYDSDNLFINVGVRLETCREISPLGILDEMKIIENKIGNGENHRDSNGKYKDRLIDIDIIAIDEIIVDVSRLKVPHPRMHEREFVVKPMIELNPNWHHPTLGHKWKDLIEGTVEFNKSRN